MRQVIRALVLFFCSNLSVVAQATPSAALGYLPKYPVNYTHFDYVNPAAPKGGTLTLSGFGTFDSLNPFILRGVSAQGLQQLVFESLMVQSLDEPYSLYAHVADDIALAADGLSVTFRIDPRARFSDDSPVLAEDVKFSFDTLKSDKSHPQYRFYWADIKSATILGPRLIRFNFVKRNPELHLIAAQIPIFSPRWVGKESFDKLSRVKPLGSGPYVVEDYHLGKDITYRRNPHYWARDLPVRRGMFNFDRIIFKYYKDETVRLEAFKAGEYDFVLENHSKMWARDYTGPQFDSGQIRREELPHKNNAGMQGFIFNLRRDLFKDKRVRKALSLAFDFTWSNRNLFYGQYVRCDSYFSNSELASGGLPQGAELQLLRKFANQLEPEIFTTVWKPPSTDNPGALRHNLIQAKLLLEQAGWHVENGRLKNAKGEVFEFEFLLDQKGFERIIGPYAYNLKKLGVEMQYRSVDVSLYADRLRQFDFDMTVARYPQSMSPGNEQYNFWGSHAADQEGSRNLIGIKNPVIDSLIDAVVFAPDRQRLVTATHALDRVLLHGEYLVPNWYINNHRVAYWNKFGRPQTLPLYYEADDWALMSWWALPTPLKGEKL
ncbi:MAG: ABC transporter substrate-binding protein [Gammaproteobacteria bacterium]|nr:ABC transporter substrate-binding protein [Gammaproteobacteria bacterium]